MAGTRIRGAGANVPRSRVPRKAVICINQPSAAIANPRIPRRSTPWFGCSEGPLIGANQANTFSESCWTSKDGAIIATSIAAILAAEAPEASLRQPEKMALQTNLAPRDMWRCQDRGLKCRTIADENHLLLRPRHRGVKQGPIEQSALGDWDHHAAELRALSLVGRDRVGQGQVREAAPPDQVRLIVEVDGKRTFITVPDHAEGAV
jgi:hypothetical protein